MVAGRALNQLAKIPFEFNITVKGPFRALIGTMRSLQDPTLLIQSTLPDLIRDQPTATPPFSPRKARLCDEAVDVDVDALRCDAGRDETDEDPPRRAGCSRSAGCVQVSAPEKPIEINLNINIRQEVVVRLQQDVRDLIKENPGVF